LRPPGQGGKQILQEAGRRGVHQSSFGVESLLGARHQHLRLAQRQGANVRQHLAQMQLGSHRAEVPRAGSHDGHRLAGQWLLRRARRPIDGILEGAADRAVVLRRGDEQRIGLCQAGA
jgi:hypothetical protein